jgi:hypothetical protein
MPIRRLAYSAITVAAATPAAPHPKTITNSRSSRDHHQERSAGVLGAEQPAEQDHGTERPGCAEQPDLEVYLEHLADLRLRGVDQASERRDRAAESDQHERDEDGEAERTNERGAQFRSVARAVGLRGQARRAHAEEDEAEVERAEGRGTERNRAQMMRFGQMPDHRRVDHAEQRHGDVGQDQRPGEATGLAVRPYGHRASGRTGGSAPGGSGGLSDGPAIS